MRENWEVSDVIKLILVKSVHFFTRCYFKLEFTVIWQQNARTSSRRPESR